jgi:hypothetical protein
MTTAVSTIPLTQEQFQEAMMARMRGIMGELMPQATLEDITKRGVEEAFFKPRTVKVGSGYHSHEETRPPWINEFLEKEMAKEVKAQVSTWLAANQETIKAAMSNTLAAGVTGCLVQFFAESFRGPMSNLKSDVNDRLMKLGQSMIS